MPQQVQQQEQQQQQPDLEQQTRHRSRSTSPESRTSGFMMGLPLEDESAGPDFKWTPVTS
jgi:hypothetical protein